ncbi:response regulator [Labilibaculum sp.]|uniref:LytR/AlgR family response regulator transcription factor n=1 Tax=Labilibaculum sp. TaxID=2060723 RepID=UPI002AA876DD|nr:response regulator [Labilibaculum sp.]
MFNIVIVDDEETIAKSIEKYCKQSPLVSRTKIETNSSKLLDDLQNSSYDDFNLYLLDIEMTVRGDVIAKKIKAKYPEVQIVFISGYEKRGNILFQNNQLTSGFLDKPVNKSELLNLLSEIHATSLVLKLFNVYDTQQAPVEKPICSADIIAITSDTSVIQKDLPKNNIALLFKNVCFRLNSTIKGFIQDHQIQDKEFIKISGSTLLNLNFIKEFSKSDETITTNNDLVFKVSRSFKPVFDELHNHFSRK